MIRSCRIPSVLRKICTDDDKIIQTALLVTTDGELLGSTATTFVSPDGSSKESIESLGTLIADIAVDYGKLGDEYAYLDPPISPPTGSTNATIASTASAASSADDRSNHSAAPSQVVVQSSSSSKRTSSHMQCLLLELELGLVAVSMCVGVDCMVIAIAAPNAPLGTVKARLQAMTAHVQEALSPLAILTESSAVATNSSAAVSQPPQHTSSSYR